MSMNDYLKNLVNLNGISGFEDNVSEYLLEVLKPKCDLVYTDKLGSVIALKKSENSLGSVMIEAHIDEIGFLVKSILDDGFLSLCPIGGIDPKIMLGSCVNIHSDKTFKGVVGAKPPHLMEKGEEDKIVSIDKLYVDVGMNKEEAQKNIKIGSFVTFDSQFTPLKNSIVSGKCMDDRASVACILDVIDNISELDFDYDIYFCFCVQEEVGLRGALCASYDINPDFAISIDVTHAVTYDNSKDAFPISLGPTVCKGPNIHRELVTNFIKVLDEKSIDYDIEVEGGNTGTDAWSIQTSKMGICTMLLSVPIRYMHTNYETLDIKSLEKTSLAITEFLKSFRLPEEVL